MKSDRLPFVYPMSLSDEKDVVDWIARITSRDESSIRSRLYLEFENPGANVVRAFAQAGLETHVWNADLAHFYEQTDAFIYELVFWNTNSVKRRMRRWIANYLVRCERPGSSILSVGDGLGIDSFYLAQAGHRVTYYEVPGFTHSFASRLFKLGSAGISVVTNHAQVPRESFDAILCLDVLEHIPDVPGFIAQLAGYLRSGGLFFVHAPFYMIHPAYPTHLRANRKYSGSLRPFHQCGLRLVDGEFFWNPLVFEKGSKDLEPRTCSTARIFALHLAGLYLALGRFSNLPFRWMNFYRKTQRRWFK